MQASRSSSVSERLYLVEAEVKRARQRRCRNERGSLGFTQRRLHCLLPRNTNHTQSPHRPLLRAGSRHAPEGARNGQSRHRGRRGMSRRHSAFLALEALGVDAFTIRDLALLGAARRPPGPIGGACEALRSRCIAPESIQVCVFFKRNLRRRVALVFSGSPSESPEDGESS
jgi:hypothetical protein